MSHERESSVNSCYRRKQTCSQSVVLNLDDTVVSLTQFCGSMSSSLPLCILIFLMTNTVSFNTLVFIIAKVFLITKRILLDNQGKFGEQH